MSEKTCAGCRHFNADDEFKGEVGSCHRYPPTVQWDPEAEDFFSAVPVVAAADRSCGEFSGLTH